MNVYFLYLLAIGCATVEQTLLLFLRLTIATPQFLAAPIDAGQFAFQVIVRFPQILNLLQNQRYALVTVHSGICVGERRSDYVYIYNFEFRQLRSVPNCTRKLY